MNAILPISEKAIAVCFGHAIDPDIHARVLGLMEWLKAHPFPGMQATVPAYASLTVYFDPWLLQAGWPNAEASPSQLVMAYLSDLLDKVPPPQTDQNSLIEIPVHYGGSYGPDLSEVAQRLGLKPSDVIRLHAATVYTVYQIGFLPGFPYMGILPPTLELPRRTTPRVRVPAGSVAIAGQQTGIYPQHSPGGWHLIGWTPLSLFDPEKRPPALLEPGDRVRFVVQ